MRKHITNNNFAAINAAQFKEGRKNLDIKKNPRYIYTEADLGEGLLDAGVSSFYDQQDNLNTKPWMNMLKTKWS
ncbi:MAG: hypothetical protein ABIR78_04145 [Ferruginibacter sp.]